MDGSTEELESNLEFLATKLAETRDVLVGEPVWIDVVKRDGNTVRRKNPAYDGYHDLMRTYLRTLSEYRTAAAGRASKEAKLAKYDGFARTMRKTASA